jgi:hypothetical protein
VLLVMNNRGAEALLSSAGVSLEGTLLRPDDDASEQVYGRRLTARSIVMGDEVSVPESGRHLVAVLEKNAPYNESRKTASRQPPFVARASVTSRGSAGLQECAKLLGRHRLLEIVAVGRRRHFMHERLVHFQRVDRKLREMSRA